MGKVEAHDVPEALKVMRYEDPVIYSLALLTVTAHQVRQIMELRQVSEEVIDPVVGNLTKGIRDIQIYLERQDRVMARAITVMYIHAQRVGQAMSDDVPEGPAS